MYDSNDSRKPLRDRLFCIITLDFPDDKKRCISSARITREQVHGEDQPNFSIDRKRRSDYNTKEIKLPAAAGRDRTDGGMLAPGPETVDEVWQLSKDSADAATGYSEPSEKKEKAESTP